jgi:transposase
LEKLVFLDESEAQTNMTRTRGRAPRGVRVIDRVPHGHWKTTTILSAIRSSAPFAAAVVSGATDSDVFRTYVEYVLVSELTAGDVVILDNLQPHKAKGVREMIEAAGATLMYLPPYSPDFNPIENMWSKVKQPCGRRRHGPSTRYNRRSLTRWATSRLANCLGFFRHCGYPAT